MTIERESREFREVTAVDLLTDEPITNFQIAITDGWNRPTEWVDPVSYNSKLGIFFDDLAPGVYRVWVKYDDGYETIVMPTKDDAGNFATVTIG